MDTNMFMYQIDKIQGGDCSSIYKASQLQYNITMKQLS